MFVPVTSSSISMSRLLVSSRRVCGLLTWGRSCSGSLERGVSKTGKELTVVVSTLRVDTVAAAGLDISRKLVSSRARGWIEGLCHVTISLTLCLPIPYLLPAGTFGWHVWKG